MKLGTIRNWMLMGAVAAVMAVPGMAQTPGALEEAHAMASKANSGAAHAAVAKQYRLHAEAMDAKAAEHEKNVAEYTRAIGASFRKNPGGAPRALQSEKAKAMEARRAARETMALADRHLRLAVEAQAVAGN